MNIAILANIVFLADFEDVVKVVVALLFVVFWILGQLGDLKKPKKAVQPGRKAPRGDVPPRVPPQGFPDQQAQPDQADPLRRKVEEMLQQAARGSEAELEARQLEERRRAAAQQVELQPSIELLVDDAPPVAKKTVARTVAQTTIQTTPAQPLRSRLPPRRRRPAAGPRAIQERVSRLGAEVALADDKIEARLEAKFGHDLGRLRDTHDDDAYEHTVATNVAANQIAALLSDPQSIRQAILLQEILKRPEDRW